MTTILDLTAIMVFHSLCKVYFEVIGVIFKSYLVDIEWDFIFKMSFQGF